MEVGFLRAREDPHRSCSRRALRCRAPPRRDASARCWGRARRAAVARGAQPLRTRGIRGVAARLLRSRHLGHSARCARDSTWLPPASPHRARALLWGLAGCRGARRLAPLASRAAEDSLPATHQSARELRGRARAARTGSARTLRLRAAQTASGLRGIRARHKRSTRIP